MPQYIIAITDKGSPAGFVGRRTLQIDRKANCLRSDYSIARDADEAMKYFTRDAAERFA
jgi:hypothetical protein